VSSRAIHHDIGGLYILVEQASSMKPADSHTDIDSQAGSVHSKGRPSNRSSGGGREDGPTAFGDEERSHRPCPFNSSFNPYSCARRLRVAGVGCSAAGSTAARSRQRLRATDPAEDAFAIPTTGQFALPSHRADLMDAPTALHRRRPTFHRGWSHRASTPSLPHTMKMTIPVLAQRSQLAHLDATSGRQSSWRRKRRRLSLAQTLSVVMLSPSFSLPVASTCLL